MSRNTQYEFIPTDPEEIVSWLTELWEKTMEEYYGVKTTVQPGSPERVYIQYLAAAIIQERVLNNWTGNQNIPSRAEGENLDALAELFKEDKRPEAAAATCTMRFTISEAQETSILIPKGTRITDKVKTLIWETEADTYIPIGETQVETTAKCQTPGTAGNGYVAGQVNVLVDIFDYYEACANVTTTGGGTDRATDEEFYEILRLSMDGYSCAGARGSYIYFAKKAGTNIADVAAVSPTPGVVKLYVLMDGGKLADEETKKKVLAECSADDRRPLTDWVQVDDAETVPYNIAFTYYSQSDTDISAAALAAAVQNAVNTYTEWQSAKLGRDINPSRLVSLLMETGIKRVELTEPTYSALLDGSTGEAPQVAALGSVTITNGGYENE